MYPKSCAKRGRTRRREPTSVGLLHDDAKSGHFKVAARLSLIGGEVFVELDKLWAISDALDTTPSRFLQLTEQVEIPDDPVDIQ